MEIRVARSARKHRIGNAHIVAAMQGTEPVAEPGTDALVFEGEDDRGVALFIIAVPDDKNPGGLTVIHCSPADWRG